jgi:SAM-dependent methyltransferase
VAGFYGEDLAYIHDVGHAGFALRSAPGILEILRENGIPDGIVVDLGCGSGLWARELLRAGYGVFGIDISGALVEIAREKAPGAEFRVGSPFEAPTPPCDAVTAVGEVLNYLFDPENEERGLEGVFGRVYGALRPGGVFVFDVLGPGQVPPGTTARGWRVGEDWAVLSEREEDAGRGRWSAGSSASGSRGSTTGAMTRCIGSACTSRMRSPTGSSGPVSRSGRWTLTGATHSGRTTPRSSPAGCDRFARSGGRAGV